MAALYKLQLAETESHLGERINIPRSARSSRETTRLAAAALAFSQSVDNFTHVASIDLAAQADDFYDMAVEFYQNARAQDAAVHFLFDELQREFESIDRGKRPSHSEDWRIHIAWRNVQDYFALLAEVVVSEDHLTLV